MASTVEPGASILRRPDESRTMTENDHLLPRQLRRVSYGVNTSISVSDEDQDQSLDDSSTSTGSSTFTSLTCRQWQASISCPAL